MALKIIRIIRSVPLLAQMWQVNMARVTGVVEQEPLTPKQFRQLRRLRNIHGDITWDVMLWALENWTQFSQEAKRCTEGSSCAPDNPDIGFLLAHRDIAVMNMYMIAKSTNTASAEWFIKNADRMFCEMGKPDAMKACEGHPEFLAMIDKVKTPHDLDAILTVFKIYISNVGEPT